MTSGFVITCFENLEHCIVNIELIRRMQSFKNSVISVISTTANNNIADGFRNLAYKPGLQPILIDVLENSAGNPGVAWEPPPTQDYDTPHEKNSWRARFLPMRLLKSMSVGFNRLVQCDCDTALHLHSDTFWKLDHEKLLLDEQDRLKEIYGIWDLCIEDSGGFGPKGIHPHPAPMHLNLQECYKLDIINFHKVFYHDTFRHYNFKSIESLIGCWANFCLCGKSVLNKDDTCCQEFYDKFKVRCQRYYHGNFPHIFSDPCQQ